MVIVELATRRRTWQLPAGGAARSAWPERSAAEIAVWSGDGELGLGEAAPLPGMSRDTLTDAERALAAFDKRLPLAIDSPRDALVAAAALEVPAARFAVETALLGAFALRSGTTVARLLMPTPDGALLRAIVVDDEHDTRLSTAACVKVKLTATATRDELARARRIACAAPQATLRFDVNRGWPYREATDRLAALADALGPAASRVEYIEEPCERTVELVHERPALPLALDESLVVLPMSSLEAGLRAPKLAALVLKPTLLGGFARCLELAALARAHGAAAVASHALEGPIGRAACGQLARALGGTRAHGVDA